MRLDHIQCCWRIMYEEPWDWPFDLGCWKSLESLSRALSLTWCRQKPEWNMLGETGNREFISSISFKEFGCKGEYKKARGYSYRMGEYRVERKFVFFCIFGLGDLTAYLYVAGKNPVERGKVGLVGKQRKNCWGSYIWVGKRLGSIQELLLDRNMESSPGGKAEKQWHSFWQEAEYPGGSPWKFSLLLCSHWKRQSHQVGARIRAEVLERWGMRGLGIVHPCRLLECLGSWISRRTSHAELSGCRHRVSQKWM